MSSLFTQPVPLPLTPTLVYHAFLLRVTTHLPLTPTLVYRTFLLRVIHSPFRTRRGEDDDDVVW